MTDADDGNNADFGGDLVNDTVLADADTVMVFISSDWFCIVRQWICGESGYASGYVLKDSAR